MAIMPHKCKTVGEWLEQYASTIGTDDTSEASHDIPPILPSRNIGEAGGVTC